MDTVPQKLMITVSIGEVKHDRKPESCKKALQKILYLYNDPIKWQAEEAEEIIILVVNRQRGKEKEIQQRAVHHRS